MIRGEMLGGDDEWIQLCPVPIKTDVSNLYLSFGYYFVVICSVLLYNFLKFEKKLKDKICVQLKRI